jgi:pimeloyl-ACP methyl ester carboxylesterase
MRVTRELATRARTARRTSAGRAAARLDAAEQRLLGHYGLAPRAARVTLEDPPLDVRVLEVGEGPPLLLVHGSGTSAASWAPLMPHLPGRRLLAVDLPGFGSSGPHDYGARPLRAHAVAQMRSLLDALDLRRAPIVGTSLGGWWALCAALAEPSRVAAVASLGIPALAFPGVRGDPFFTAMTTPGVGRLVARLPPPSTRMVRASMARGALGRRAAANTPDEWFETAIASMRMPGWHTAMWSHLNLAFRTGRPRPGNHFSDDELRRIRTPVLFIWGEEDVYGGPEIGRRACAVMPDARLEVLPGGHAPFLDDPERCGALISEFLARTELETRQLR